MITLLISDVPGDRPIDIASGPTVADPQHLCRCPWPSCSATRIDLPAPVRAVLQSGRGESIKPGDPRLARSELRMVATPQRALEAAAQVARDAGVAAHILSDALEGEARDVGKVLAGLALQTAERGQPFMPPCVLLSGGETTVTVRGQGRGGRNVECLLSFTVATHGHPAHPRADGRHTDGVDGQGRPSPAPAWAPPPCPAPGHRACIRWRTLADNDGHGFFGALGASVITGPHPDQRERLPRHPHRGGR